jgi:L-ascorbate metabolism protein UlaG (beta-lactamase superfamily)
MSWRTFTDFLKHNTIALRLADRLGRGRGRARWLDSLSRPPAAAHKPDLTNWQSHTLAAAWIGHSTVLLRIAGLTILTDPVFSSRIGLGMAFFTLGPQRKIAPALTIRELPPIDLILLSHAHFDHLDRPTLARLDKSTPIITAPKTRDLLDDLGFKSITELSWGESTALPFSDRPRAALPPPLTIRAEQVNHWGARTFYDTHRGYNAYILDSGSHRVLYAGDTAYTDHFRTVGKIRLAIFGISAYDPFIQAHATPEQVWEMANHLPADFLLPVHHSTFQLSHEPLDEPLRRLITAAGDQAHRIVIHEPGEMWADDATADERR